MLSNEEIELCARIGRTGKIAVYAPDAVVEHVIHTERLTQSWFRRRAAWQAVSDVLARPDEAPALAAEAARRLAPSLFSRRRLSQPSDRNTAQGMHDDMVMLYSATVLALCGDGGPAAPHGPGRLRHAFLALLGR